MPGLKFTLLGSFEVHLNGRPVTKFRSANVQGLLIFLVLNGERPFARETLATLFWPDEPNQVAKQNLRQSLYHLRKVLGDSDSHSQPILHVTRHSIQFNTGVAYSLDVEQFVAAVNDGDLETAVILYTDELVPGFTCDSLEFEDFFCLQCALDLRLKTGESILSLLGILPLDY